jgi:hypothetical protein
MSVIAGTVGGLLKTVNAEEFQALHAPKESQVRTFQECVEKDRPLVVWGEVAGLITGLESSWNSSCVVWPSGSVPLAHESKTLVE